MQYITDTVHGAMRAAAARSAAAGRCAGTGGYAAEPGQFPDVHASTVIARPVIAERIRHDSPQIYAPIPNILVLSAPRCVRF